jgi:tetratricopeptide (TPR) repeat protein
VFRHPLCLEKFAGFPVATSVTGAAMAGVPAPPGVLEAATSGGGLLAVLSGRRRADAERIRRQFTADLKREWRAWGTHSPHADAGLRESVVTSFEEVVPHVTPLPAEVVSQNLDPEAIAQRVLAKAVAARPEVYGDDDPRNADAHLARSFLLNLTRRAYAHLIAQPGFVEQIAPDLWHGVLEQLNRIEGKVDGLNARIAELEAKLSKMAEAKAAVAEGVSPAALIRLVRPIATDVEDAATAMVELTRAVETARQVQAEGRAGSNSGDFVDEVLRRMAELSAAGDYDAAAAEIDAALAREEAESKARQVRLLDAGVEQDILRRDAGSAAGRLACKAELELPEGGPLFEALRIVGREWHERGRDMGLNFDLEVAIALAGITCERAVDADQRATAFNELGNALADLGAREAGTGRLEKAVAAYSQALTRFTRERVPLAWARTQMKLGTALTDLGERETGTERLEEAVAAFRLALHEQKREQVPFDWARTQANLGVALATLGAREADNERLEEAIVAYRLALQVRTRERVPLDWAMTQSNLGEALKTVGARVAGTERLGEAVAAFRLALQEWTRERVPFYWAGAQLNLGAALATLGAREAGTERLEGALAANRLALQELTRERTPLIWANAQLNIGTVLAELGGREAGTERLEEAVDAYHLALQEWTRERVPLKWALVHSNLCRVELMWFDKTGRAARLEAAEAHLAATREVFEAATTTEHMAQADGLAAWIAARRGDGS